jgi:hypothetical protein
MTGPGESHGPRGVDLHLASGAHRATSRRFGSTVRDVSIHRYTAAVGAARGGEVRGQKNGGTRAAEQCLAI